MVCKLNETTPNIVTEPDIVNVTWNPDGEFGCGCRWWVVMGLSGQHVVWELCNKHFQIMQHMASIESCDFERNKVSNIKTEAKISELDF